MPEPMAIVSPDKVGLCEVLQQTPLAVTGDPPSDVTLPPMVADVSPIPVTAAVETDGATLLTVRTR